jgi:CrcB protein
MELPDRHGRDEAVMTSRWTADPALPIDPDLDRGCDARPDGPEARADARPDGPCAGSDGRSDGRPDARSARRGLGSRLRPGILAAIAVGGAFGGAARYDIERVLPAARDQFPWATFVINVSGSLALSVLLVFVLEIWPPTRYVRPFAAIGFLGAYTTFSTWMVETAELVAHDRPGLAVGYLGGSLLAGLAAVSLGLVLGRAVLAVRGRAGAPAGRS